MTRVSLILVLTLVSCVRELQPDVASVRSSINAQLQRGVEATRNKDLEIYMSILSPDLVIHDESGEVITREQQRANVERDWGIIERTLDIEVKLDSMRFEGDSATVFTSQRWERLMYRRDGVTLDTVVTTQKHRELWRQHERQWRNERVEELGGTVLINGAPYVPPPDSP